MALHNPKMLFLFFFCSLLLSCHVAQPDVSPSPTPESDAISSPSPGPTSASPSSPGSATVPSPSTSPSPAPGHTQSSGSPSPGTSSSSGPELGPSSSSRPAPGLSSSSDDDDLDDEVDTQQDPISLPISSGPAPGLSSSSDDDDLDDEVDTQQDPISIPPSNSDSSSPSMAPSPSADAPSASDCPIEFDFSPTIAPTADVDPQVKKICDSTDYSSLCLATVAPYVDGKTDISSVLNVAIQAGAKFAKYGQTTAQKLAGKPGNPSELASILDDCMENFDSAGENFGKAGDALPEHDKGTLDTMLSAVITYAGDCHDSIPKDSQLYNISDRLMHMASNCLAISSLMN